MHDQEKRLVESALFMSSQPLSLKALSRLLEQDSHSLTLKVLEELEQEFNNSGHALEIVRINEKYAMRVKKQYADRVSHFAVSPELGRAALRTLALVALKQPVKQSDIVKVIGNKAYDYIKELSGRGIIKAEKKANTKILSTTKKFEEYFGKTPEELQLLALGK